MNEQHNLLEQFGQTKTERGFSLVIFVAVTAGIAASLLNQPRSLFMTAWSVAAVIVSWDLLVFRRQRREDNSDRPQPW